MRAAELLQKVLERNAEGEMQVPSYDNMHTPDNHVGKKNMKTVKNPEKGLDVKRDEHPTAEVGTPGKESRSMEGPGTTPKKMSEEQINELEMDVNPLVASLKLRYDGANERLLVNHPGGTSKGKAFYLPISRGKLERALMNQTYRASPLTFYTQALKQSQGGPARQMQIGVGEDAGGAVRGSGNGGRQRHAYLQAAKEMITDDDDIIYDVAVSHDQEVENVKHMKWFRDEVADWLEREGYPIPVVSESIKIKENDEEPTLEIWWNGGHGWEEVDTAKDKKEANYLIGEYRMAYGGGQFKTKRIKKAAIEASGEPANPSVAKMTPAHSASVPTKQQDEPKNKGEPGMVKKKEKRADAAGCMDANPVSVADFKGGSNEHKSMKKMHEAIRDLEDFLGTDLQLKTDTGSKKKLSESQFVVHFKKPGSSRQRNITVRGARDEMHAQRAAEKFLADKEAYLLRKGYRVYGVSKNDDLHAPAISATDYSENLSETNFVVNFQKPHGTRQRNVTVNDATDKMHARASAEQYIAKHEPELLRKGYTVYRITPTDKNFPHAIPAIGTDQKLGEQGYDNDDDNGDDDGFDLHGELETGVVIGDARGGKYSLSAESKFIDEFSSMDEALGAANAWMDRHNYWPNLFYVNERGNVDLLDKEGNIIRGWV